MRIAGLIVAAGSGRRLGNETPKQYLRLEGTTILAHSMTALSAHPEIDAIQVVIRPGDDARYAEAIAGFSLEVRLLPPVHGAASRSGSVRAGLGALAVHAPPCVLIHDAARPFLSRETISAVVDALEDAPAACPVLPVVDALWQGAGGLAQEPVARENLWRAQTPQGFRFAEILAAHNLHRGDAADDVAVARAAGLPVRLVPGSEENIKITTTADLAAARSKVEGGMDIRTGNGFDVHAFGPGNAVTLCGVRIPAERALTGHSDADVGMHALTDAIFGALAEGDIGQWFPPSDPQWKGAASNIFLAKAVERAGARGYALSHLDCTLVCEAPKIGPHAAAMRAELARIAGIAAERISIKATTSEGLGFTGRGEGIAALATATLVRP